ncbi:MAG: LysR substrate-binding domain-containing protein [Betaproteobacteria bacterium]
MSRSASSTRPSEPELDFAELQALSAVGRTGSLVKAAVLLGVGSPAISKQLTRLESKLGAKLIHRTTRSALLSPAGMRMAAEFERAQEILNQAVEEARSEAMTPRGVLRLTAPPVLFNHVLAPIVSEFLTSNPEVNLEIDLSLRFVEIGSEGFDVALRVANHAPADYVAIDLGSIDWGIYASDAYLRLHGSPSAPEELVRHRYIAAKVHRGESRIELKCKDQLASLTLRPVVSSQNAEATCHLIADGVGVGALPDYLVRVHPQRTRLRRVLNGWNVFNEWGSKLFALSLPGRAIRPATRAFLDSLRNRVQTIFTDR